MTLTLAYIYNRFKRHGNAVPCCRCDVTVLGCEGGWAKNEKKWFGFCQFPPSHLLTLGGYVWGKGVTRRRMWRREIEIDRDIERERHSVICDQSLDCCYLPLFLHQSRSSHSWLYVSCQLIRVSTKQGELIRLGSEPLRDSRTCLPWIAKLYLGLILPRSVPKVNETYMTRAVSQMVFANPLKPCYIHTHNSSLTPCLSHLLPRAPSRLLNQSIRILLATPG